MTLRPLHLALTLVFAFASPAAAQEAGLKALRTPVGTTVQVTAGQEFYAETKVEQVPAYKLERPFKSSMAGAGGFPFGFEIGSDLLMYYGQSENGWQYFVPEKFRAYHGLLGSVIRQGDTVGLRVGTSGNMEWFVDNSVYNGFTTIWSRRVKPKDPKLTRIMTEATRPTGGAVERLIYLGLDANKNARIRYERVYKSDVVRDEFTFPLDDKGQGLGAVRGAEFQISATPLSAQITVTKAMSSGIGDPVAGESGQTPAPKP